MPAVGKDTYLWALAGLARAAQTKGLAAAQGDSACGPFWARRHCPHGVVVDLLSEHRGADNATRRRLNCEMALLQVPCRGPAASQCLPWARPFVSVPAGAETEPKRVAARNG